jgi:cytosine/uracil/thiamine/allantoin permease
MFRRNVVMLGSLAALLAAAWFVLHAPDVGEGLAFFTAGIPTMAAGEAVMTLLAWLVIAVAASATVVTAVRDFRTGRSNGRPYPTASILLAVGLLLLAVGAVQRALPDSSICCGSGAANIREAISLAR